MTSGITILPILGSGESGRTAATSSSPARQHHCRRRHRERAKPAGRLVAAANQQPAPHQLVAHRPVVDPQLHQHEAWPARDAHGCRIIEGAGERGRGGGHLGTASCDNPGAATAAVPAASAIRFTLKGSWTTSRR